MSYENSAIYRPTEGTRRTYLRSGIRGGNDGGLARKDDPPDYLIGYEIGQHDRQIEALRKRIEHLEQHTRLVTMYPRPERPEDV